MPTPQEAAAILKAAMANGFDPAKLALLRSDRLDEMKHNRDMEQTSNADALRSRIESRFASPSERNRNAMMGWDLGTPTSRSGATASDVGNLEEDIHNDPYTGDAEQARIGGIQKSIDAANTTMRDDVGQAAKTTSDRNAFAEFMKNKGQRSGALAGEVTPEGMAALDLASRRKQAEAQASFGVKDAARPLSAEGTKTVEALHEAQVLGLRLHKLLTDKMRENPQDVADPQSGSEVGSIVGQIPDVASSHAKRALYAMGFKQPPGKYDEITRLADQMKVIASRGYMGSIRNMDWVNQIQDHLTNGKLPDAANLERLNGFLQTAPEIEQAVYDVEKGHKRLGDTRGALPAGVTVRQVR